MKILLINPRSLDAKALSVPPLGILYIAGYIGEKGFDQIEIIDDTLLKLPAEELEKKIKYADVVGVTGSTAQIKYAIEISFLCNKHKKICVIGGPHATPMAEDILKNSKFDIVVRGEGEEVFLNIIKNFEKKDFSKIKGISYIKNSKIFHNEDQPFIKDLDSISFPARDLIPMDRYPRQELTRFTCDKFTNIITSRGCPNACTFCSSPITWRRTLRMRSAKNVFSEIVHLHKEYGFKCFHFVDDTFTVSKKRVTELCDMLIESDLDIEWSCLTRPDTIDYNLCKKMVQAGCKQVDLGVESGSEKLLKIAKKKYTRKQIKNAFEISKKAGLLRHGFFMIGLPGENLYTYFQTIVFALSLKLDSSVWTVLLPFPGTEIYNKKLVRIIDPDYVNWLYKTPVIKTGFFGPRRLIILRKLADIFVNKFSNPVYKNKS